MCKMIPRYGIHLVGYLNNHKIIVNSIFTLYTSVPPSTKMSSTVSTKGGADNMRTADQTLLQTWWAPCGGSLI